MVLVISGQLLMQWSLFDMKLIGLISLLAVSHLSSCSSCNPEPVVPESNHDSETWSSCDEACVHARELGCEVGQPSKTGNTCEEVCENAAAYSILFNTACVVKAQSCTEVATCQG